MEKEKVFYEDVKINDKIPSLIKQPTTRQLVKWAGVSGDYYEIHYDKDIAQKSGLPGVVVHGKLVVSFLAQMITDWIGEDGDLKVISCGYRGLLYPGEDAICNGKIAKKYVEDGKHYAECEIWVENSKNQSVIKGKAIVVLPSKYER